MSERKRRQYGSGSIFQRSSDGRWMGVIQAGYLPSGGRRTITVSSRISEADCRRKLDRKRADIARNGIPDPKTAHATVKAFAADWLAQQETRLRPNAYRNTRWAVQEWIVPTLGHRRLEELRVADIRALHKALRDAGLKPSSMTRVHASLMPMVKAAMIEGHQVPPNVLLVERPGVNVSDRTALPAADAASLLSFAAGTLPHATRWQAALLQGFRQGEALGLTWAAYDRFPDRIDISWQLQALPYRRPRDRSSGFRVPDNYEAVHLVDRWHLTRPKTNKGRRTVPKLPFFADAMEVWRAVAPASPHDLVWPAADGSPADPKDDLAEWKALQATVGVTHPSGRFYVVHETRHTTASLLLQARVDRRVIEDILGQVKLVEEYLHVTQTQHEDGIAAVGAALRLAPAPLAIEG